MPAPYSQTELIQSVDILKVTVPRMNHLSIPLTPENYAVWYEYSQGTTLALNKIIDDYLNEGISFNREINKALYEQFIAGQSVDSLNETQAATRVILESLVHKIQGMTNGAIKFGGALSECKQMLEGDLDVTKLTTIVTRVFDETESMSTSNQQMLTNLAAMEKEMTALRNKMEGMSDVAYTDQLTRVANRWAFDQHMQLMFDEFKISNKPFSIILIDIDNFKQFNDTYGHAIGDKVLIYTASSLTAGVSESDMVARYGGEEFIVVLLESDYDKSIAIANSIRKKISLRKLSSAKTKEMIGRVTISAGVSCVTLEDDVQSLIERADKAMYLAKDSGRNKVCGERELP